MRASHTRPIAAPMHLNPFSTVLTDGTTVSVRELHPEDRTLIQSGFSHLSDRSRWLRFMHAVDHLTDTQLSELTQPNDRDHFAVGATEITAAGDEPAALGRYIRLDHDPACAEMALTVVDDYHGLGLGTLLLGILAKAAAADGITSFIAYVDPGNRAMWHLLGQLGGQIPKDLELPCVLPLHVDPSHYPETVSGDIMRRAYDLANFNAGAVGACSTTLG